MNSDSGAKYIPRESWPGPPKTSFDVEYIGKKDRGSYVAAIACPKPMLFLNGTKDTLFGIASVNRCYKKMSEVWHSQNADNNQIILFQQSNWEVGSFKIASEGRRCVMAVFSFY